MSERQSPDDRPSAAALAEEEALFFEAVSITRMPMVVTDPYQPDNPIIFANRAFLDLTGYREGDVIGRNCRFLQGPETDRTTVARLSRAVNERRVFSAEIMNYRKDGSAFWNALFISPLVDRSGKLRYFFSSQLDVSRRHDAEEALRHAQKMEALGQFTGSIAHDFNNLLQVITGYLDTLRPRFAGQGDADAEAALATISAAADRGTMLTRQLLGFARKQRLEGRVVCLNDLVRTIRAMAAKVLSVGVTVETRLEADLWNARLDPVQAEMAILNLLMNARDAMPDGGRIVIETANRTVGNDHLDAPADLLAGRYVVLTISDSGGGMPREVLARALDPFFTTKEAGRGTGLGLSMAYGFMRQSNGSLRITSEEGRGTQVSLYFPASIGDAPSRVSPSVLVQPRLLGSETILVVEDQPDIAALATAILSDSGYRVMSAPNGDAALAILEEQAGIHLLFSDLIMPGAMNGVMLARTARDRFPGIRVLLATGFAAEVVDRDGGYAGEFEILGKPYRRGELLARVRDVLDAPPAVPPATPV
ncbi:histidine kinase famiy protein [Elioraea sp.]|uniref:histidine kinase famiy protein n=1 Tax=Elioraea sp. TaxID=2185103 RepID=UPI0025B7C5EB|nr:histidine kinase famiy protein [Elioraea sp.]